MLIFFLYVWSKSNQFSLELRYLYLCLLCRSIELHFSSLDHPPFLLYFIKTVSYAFLFTF